MAQSRKNEDKALKLYALLFSSEPLHYDGPGEELLLLLPRDEEATSLLLLLLAKRRFAGLAKCLCRMLRSGLDSAPLSLWLPLPRCGPRLNPPASPALSGTILGLPSPFLARLSSTLFAEPSTSL